VSLHWLNNVTDVYLYLVQVSLLLIGQQGLGHFFKYRYRLRGLAAWTRDRFYILGMDITCKAITIKQCCGSMTFWCGSGSGDPCLLLMGPDLDPDPGSGSCYFRHWPSRCQQKTNEKKNSAYILLFFKVKKSKKPQNSTVGIKVFLSIFAWW
jgi:hypothetical protein